MAGIPPIAPYVLPTRDSLPDNVARWTVSPERAVLLIHDMQRYFLKELPDPLRSDLLGNAASLRKRASGLDVQIAYTVQPGRMTDDQRGLLLDFWGPGMRTVPADRDVVPELAPAEGDWILTKWRYSAFHRSDLLERMRAAGRDQLVVCGVYAHVGVLATALEAFTNDIKVFVVADAVGDFSADHHWLAVRYVARRSGMVILTEEAFT